MATSYGHQLQPQPSQSSLCTAQVVLNPPAAICSGCSSFSPSPYKSKHVFNVWSSCWAFVLGNHALFRSFSLQSTRHAAFSQVHYRPCMVSIIAGSPANSSLSLEVLHISANYCGAAFSGGVNLSTHIKLCSQSSLWYLYLVLKNRGKLRVLVTRMSYSSFLYVKCFLWNPLEKFGGAIAVNLEFTQQYPLSEFCSKEAREL